VGGGKDLSAALKVIDKDLVDKKSKTSWAEQGHTRDLL
jgi:hypothetical protein